MSPWQPIKFSDLDKSHIKRAELFNKHICETKSNISHETAEIVKFYFSHYKSMETIICNSNQSSYPTGTKKHNYSFLLPIDAIYDIMRRIDLAASEEKSFENVHDGRTTDAGCLHILYIQLR